MDDFATSMISFVFPLLLETIEVSRSTFETRSNEILNRNPTVAILFFLKLNHPIIHGSSFNQFSSPEMGRVKILLISTGNENTKTLKGLLSF